MPKKKETEEDKYKKALKQYHKLSDRHILVVETDMPYSDVLKVVNLSDDIRKAGNELVGDMRKKYNQLLRTKKYRKLLELYGKAKNKKDKKETKRLADQLNEMQEEYNVTWDYCRTTMLYIAKKYGVKAVFGLTKAEDVWRGIEKCLYDNGKSLHFAKFGDYPCIRAKQITRAITVSTKNDSLSFALDNIKFGIKIKDRFQQEEVDAVLTYLSHPKQVDHDAVNLFLKDGYCIDTYRPCYTSLVVKKIRGKYRVFLHLAIEGKAKPKYDKYGNQRHKYGTGIVGSDIGTQSVAWTSNTEVGLKNIAERGNSIQTSERKEKLLHRAMERSRRATNPQNYNSDGTIKKGKKIWYKSNHYKKLQARHQELCRINAENRQLAINEDANHLRSLGNIFITEPKAASKWAKRAKETTKNKNGKINRKKRYGKSVKNRCPGGFLATVEKKFDSTGGISIEVPNNYRASQYDHTVDDYIQKKLNDRMYHLQDGTLIQRDWYSSYLLYCCNPITNELDKEKCMNGFDEVYEKEKALIEYIKTNKIKVLNSGIRI